ncbi:MAG TPA: hypothetical protein VNZ03_26035 [Terriglobales bacterium]|jgi:hypothetical protein|nr:hypothetical protein [Terriglobales bacterium]
MNRLSGSRGGNCRKLLAPSRVRRQVMAEKFDQQWRELRRYVTIEKDSQKLAKLITDWRNAQR